MLDVESNMTIIHYIKSHFSYLQSLLYYRKTYRNYLTIVLHILRKKYPVKAVLNTGEELILKNQGDAFAVAHGKRNCYEIDDEGKITIFMKELDKRVILYTSKNSLGGIYSAFLSDTWKQSQMENKVVIDIGAWIGDSSISFAMNGAKKVIALEPLPQSYELAKKNIEANNLSNKIDLLFAACGSKDGYITVNPKEESTPQASLKTLTDGIKIPVISLGKLLEMYHVDSAILKMNCEGCEFDTILQSPREVLEKFDYIIVEYHYGYKNLKRKLEDCGFTVTITAPVFSFNPHAEKLKMYIGKLYAKRNM